MTVTAPYTFARINRWVHFPDWADEVSHDVPFADGFCGEIEIEIEAASDLLVGGARRRPQAGVNGGAGIEGEVWPFQLPSGQWAIPPTALQGMIRAVMEIVSFARLAPFVDDRRFGYRALSGPDARAVYGSAMTPPAAGTHADPYVGNARPGWLRRGPHGPEIVACAVARVHVTHLPWHPTLERKSDAAKRIQDFLLGALPPRNLLVGDFARLNTGIALPAPGNDEHQMSNGKWIRETRCTLPGTTPATLVLTGKPQDGLGNGQKKREFFFHGPDRPGAVAAPATHPVADDVWRDFKMIHDAQLGRKINPNWGVWKPFYDAGEPVPVFFLEDAAKQSIIALGTAYMFKLALPFSTHQMLKHSTPDHRSDRPDLPTLIFGSVRKDGEQAFSLKRRVAFETAIAKCAPVLTRSAPTVLLSPKPSYAGTYVRQPERPGNELLRGELFATYKALAGGPEWATPEMSGVKIWPVGTGAAAVQPPPPGINHNVQTRLNTLPAGTGFEPVRVHLHNLRPVEIGALLWALTHGDPVALGGSYGDFRHRIGMGKPYGFGVIKIKIKANGLRLRANRRGAPVPDAMAFVAAYEDHMQGQCPDGVTWKMTAQFEAVRRAAAAGTGAYPRRYMPLDHADSYIIGRTARRFLAPYRNGDEPPRAPEPGTDPPPDRPPPVAAPPPIAAAAPAAPGAWIVGNRISAAGEPALLLEVRGNDLLVDWQDGGAPFWLSKRDCRRL